MQIKSFAQWILAISIASLAACGDDGGDGGKDAPPAAELTCASYCSSITANCTTANSQFLGMTDCMASCTHYPLGALSDMSGNTLGCRIYHAGAAASGPDVHCRHAGPGGNTACGDNCLGFCTLVLGSCSGAFMQFNGDMATCMTACAGYATTPPYSSTVTNGASFACHLYHATQAAVAPDPHCGHAGTSDPTMTPCK